ncbi:MAG TPA: hypothetical protein VKW06_16850 [Candidatus Angelobacter sp.]|nr:hypothetical protein [Candidatus Angelobacter sp.]
MVPKLQTFSRKIVRLLTVVLLASVSWNAQAQGAQPGQLTETQAQALLKKLSTAPATTRPLTAAEIKGLLQYVSDQAKQQAAADQAAAAASAKPKKIRLGIVMPKADLGPGFSGDAVAEPLRGLISHYLTGPTIEMVALDALVTSQIDAEAQAKQCDFILYTSASQAKKGGNGMSLFKGASTMANMMPMVAAAKVTGGMMSAAGSAANAATAAQEAASLSKGIKAKSEVSLEYRLQAPGSANPVSHDVFSQKANTDGDDVLTPLVGKLAEAVAAQVTK